MSRLLLPICLLLACLTSACGLKGDLYLPVAEAEEPESTSDSADEPAISKASAEVSQAVTPSAAKEDKPNTGLQP